MIGTLQGLKDYLAIDNDKGDARLSVALGRGSELVKAYCRTPFELQTYTDELYDGTGTDTLQLNSAPIVSVTSIAEGGSALTFGTDPNAGTYDVLWYADEGHLVRPYGCWYPLRRNVKVTSQRGYASVPAIVEQGAYEYAALVNEGKNRIGMNSKTIGQQVTQFTNDLPKHIREGLDFYRDLSAARRVA